MNQNPDEKWLKIKNHEDYMISNFGNVYSTKTNKLMSLNGIRSGYRSVGLQKESKIYAYKIHRLVALHFIPNDSTTDVTKSIDHTKFVNTNKGDTLVVNHKDGNKLNNHVDNLEWITLKENTKQGYITGNNKLTKRSVNQLDEHDNVIATFESLIEAEKQTGARNESIAKVCRGRQVTANGFKWCYAEINPNDCVIDVNDLNNYVKVNNYPSYMISEEGTIYNPKFKKILKQQINADGYKQISLANNNISQTFLVHRLVAEHFIPKIAGKDQVNHKDGDKLNSNVDNLEWVNNSENKIHANKLKQETKSDEKKPTKKGSLNTQQTQTK